MPRNPRVTNVILIIADTLRRDHVGVYTRDGRPPGRPWKIRTPNLDRFAERALIFDNAFSCSFPTVPTRNDILTGRYTFTYKPWAPIDAKEVTLQETLRRAGRLTSLVVDTPHPFTPGFNYQRGFENWEVIRGQEHDAWKGAPREVKLPCAPRKLRNPHGTVVQYLRNMTIRKSERDYFPARTMTYAAEWLEACHRTPFFLYVDTFDPHEPWDPPRHYVDMYDPGYDGEEVTYPAYDYCDYLTERELQHCQALYAGEVSLVDTWIGHLLDTAERCGLFENTAIIVTSDHGFHIGEHGYIGKALIKDNPPAFATTPLYPEICHIPLLVCAPGVLGGRRVKDLVQTVDLMPTICELLGVKVPPTVQSHGFASVLDGGRGARKLAVACPCISAPNIVVPDPTARATITDGEWLLIYGSTVPAGASVPAEVTAAVDSIQRRVSRLQRGPLKRELYHFKKDPTCLKDALKSNQGRAERLRGEFLTLLKRSNVPEKHLQYFAEI